MIEPVPQPEHERFDDLCRELAEYDALPSPPPSTPDQLRLEHPDEHLNDQILAALISP
jgi:hypothetical protein